MKRLASKDALKMNARCGKRKPLTPTFSILFRAFFLMERFGHLGAHTQ